MQATSVKMLTMTDKKKISIVLLTIFGLLLGGMGVFWWIFNHAYSSATATAADSQPLPPTATTNETELVILHDQAHTALNEHSAGLLESGFLRVDDMVALKKELAQADAAYQQGNSTTARPIYKEILAKVNTLLTQQKNQRVAEQLAAELIEQLKDTLAIKNAAPVPYQLAFDASDQGRSLMRKRQYTAAVTTLQEGLTKLEELKQTAADIAQKLIETATQALANNDLVAAGEAVSQLASVHPKHPEIAGLRASIKTITALQAEYQAFDTLLTQKAFTAALARYDQLIAQYPEIQIIQQKRQTAQQLYIEHTVQPLIAEAESLYKKGDLTTSLSTFKAAQRILPEDPSIEEAIQLIENEIRDRTIADKLAKAYTAFQAGQWRAARTLYTEVLALDSNNREAQKGKDTATQWLIKKIQYEQLIANTEQDYHSGNMAAAIVQLNEALAIKPDSIALTPAQAAMRDDLQQQNKKVSVSIKSDNRCYVSIIGVLPPEQFKHKELKLYPNVYTVKAQRTGYLEVEQELKVNANNPSQSIYIRCTERL